MNPRALLHPGIFERTGPLGWFIQKNGTSGVVCSPGVSVSPIEDGTSGVSFIKEAGNGFEGFLEE